MKTMITEGPTKKKTRTKRKTATKDKENKSIEATEKKTGIKKKRDENNEQKDNNFGRQKRRDETARRAFLSTAIPIPLPGHKARTPPTPPVAISITAIEPTSNTAERQHSNSQEEEAHLAHRHVLTLITN